MEHWLPVTGRRVCVQRALTLSTEPVLRGQKMCSDIGSRQRCSAEMQNGEKRSHVGMDRVPGAS